MNLFVLARLLLLNRYKRVKRIIMKGGVMVSRILKSAALMLATTAFASAASASCGGTYCSSSSSMPSLGSWTSNTGSSYTSGSSYALGSGSYSSSSSYTSGAMTAQQLGGTYDYSGQYSSPSYSYGSSYSSSSYGGVMSNAQADATYGTGSISQTYTGGDVELYPFSGQLSGLGANESLQATNCPTNVYNPEGGRVLGCYNVVKPVPQTNYVRVVRPIIYVRYPVPVAVPTYTACNMVTHYSRYGGWSWNQGLDYRRRCGF